MRVSRPCTPRGRPNARPPVPCQPPGPAARGSVRASVCVAPLHCPPPRLCLSAPPEPPFHVRCRPAPPRPAPPRPAPPRPAPPRPAPPSLRAAAARAGPPLRRGRAAGPAAAVGHRFVAHRKWLSARQDSNQARAIRQSPAWRRYPTPCQRSSPRPPTAHCRRNPAPALPQAPAPRICPAPAARRRAAAAPAGAGPPAKPLSPPTFAPIAPAAAGAAAQPRQPRRLYAHPSMAMTRPRPLRPGGGGAAATAPNLWGRAPALCICAPQAHPRHGPAGP
jgi:hypothetical protein